MKRSNRKRPDDFSFDDLVNNVAAAPAGRKLIILDCGYLPCDARSGVIGNEFAAAVARQSRGVKGSAPLGAA